MIALRRQIAIAASRAPLEPRFAMPRRPSYRHARRRNHRNVRSAYKGETAATPRTPWVEARCRRLFRDTRTMRPIIQGAFSRSIGRLHLAQFLIDLQCFLV